MLRTRLPLPVARAFDLHVLGLPPAFVLSQDQTLKLNEILIADWSLYLLLTSPKHTRSRLTAHAMVYLDNVTVRVSLVAFPFLEKPARTPPSTFLFLPIQLSNSVFIGVGLHPKQSNLLLPTNRPGDGHPRSSRRSRSASAAQGSVAVSGGYIGRGTGGCQQSI